MAPSSVHSIGVDRPARHHTISGARPLFHSNTAATTPGLHCVVALGYISLNGVESLYSGQLCCSSDGLDRLLELAHIPCHDDDVCSFARKDTCCAEIGAFRAASQSEGIDGLKNEVSHLLFGPCLLFKQRLQLTRPSTGIWLLLNQNQAIVFLSKCLGALAVTDERREQIFRKNNINAQQL